MKFPTGCPYHYGLTEEPKTSRGCRDCEACWEEAISGLDKTEKTNEEHYRQCRTEELAKFIVCVAKYGALDEVFKGGHESKDFYEKCVEWLKQPHKEVSKVMENICAIIYKDGQYEIVDMEKKEACSCKSPEFAAIAAHQITVEWAERHKKEKHYVDAPD